MRFTPLVQLLAGVAFVNAFPVLEKKDGGVLGKRDIQVTYKGCDLITPKVFIISMVLPID